MGLTDAEKTGVIHKNIGKDKQESQEIYPKRMKNFRWLFKNGDGGKIWIKQTMMGLKQRS